MRPANQHRQIRPTTLSSEAAGKNVLLHFSSAGESRVSISASSQSKPPAQSAAQLQSRVQELEKENFQLRHHVQQAEQSLRNYRELLGNHRLPSSSNSASPQQPQQQPQTSSDSGAAASLAALEVAHRELQQRLQEVSKQKDRFARKLDEYAQQARERDGLRREAEEMRAAARQKDEEIAALRAQLATAHQALASPRKFPAVASSSSSSCTVCVPIRTLHSLQNSVRELRKELVSLRMSSKQSLSSFALSLAGDLSETVRERVAKLADLAHSLQSNLNAKTHELIVLRVESEREKRELLDQLEKLSSATSNQESLSFASPHKQAQHTQHAVAMVSSAVGTSPEKACFVTPVFSRKAPSPSLRRDVFCSPMLDWKLHELHQDTVNKNLSIKEQEIADLRAEREAMSRTTQALREQLLAAHTAWQNLCTLHAAEMKAIRHVAHIKELMRVAKEREQTLEKERAHMEIKYLKEIQGALNFSLNTAEQSLSETHPHVVVKLVEGRTKRVKFFEQAFAKKLKDIEQRSLDTCVVNAGHLEQFQKKAIENEKNAEAMTQAANEELAKRLRTGQLI